MSDRLRDVTAGRTGPKAGWFSGRGRRREYWLFVGPALVAMFVFGAAGVTALSLLAGIPMLFAYIRRLHDLGHSGWWAPVINVATNIAAGVGMAFGGDVGALLGSLPFLAAVVILGALPGQKDRNEYGPPPGKQDVAETFS